MKICKILLIFAVVMIISLSSTPLTSSMILKKENNDSPIGCIIGGVFLCCFPPEPPITGAKVKLEGDFLTRTTHSGLNGMFSFLAVKVGRQYKITVSHPFYVTQSETITITEDQPIYTIGFYLSQKDRKNEKINTEDATCSGTLYGSTCTKYCWSFNPVPLAIVDAGVKKTISGVPLGSYQLTGLPLNQELTITASKPGYISDTIKITLTEDQPSYYYCFDLQENDDETEKEKTTGFGTVSGQVGWVTGGYSGAVIPFATVKIKGGRTKLCNAIGWYMFTGLQFDRTYEITADAAGYDSQTLSVTLTKETPHQELYFYLEKNDDETTKQRTNEDYSSNNKGKIYGYTVSSYAWSWNPISNVLVTTGLAGKSTISDGAYSISDLPLNTPITITGRKIGYYSDSKTITLTNEDSEKYLILNLQPVSVKSRAKNIGLMNNLFTLASFGSDTRSNLFCASTFVS